MTQNEAHEIINAINRFNYHDDSILKEHVIKIVLSHITDNRLHEPDILKDIRLIWRELNKLRLDFDESKLGAYKCKN